MDSDLLANKMYMQQLNRGQQTLAQRLESLGASISAKGENLLQVSITEVPLNSLFSSYPCTRVCFYVHDVDTK